MSLKVVLGLTSGLLSGVDVFSVSLVSALRAAGFDAHIMITETPGTGRWPLPLPTDVPVVRIPPGRNSAANVRTHLERLAPCIYIPNYDISSSLASTSLYQGVSIVGIVHSDDPFHYAHVRRLGRFWDAVVAVSDHTARRTQQLFPELWRRVVTIPYGVDVPRHDAPRNRCDDALRILYPGRIDQEQKRVFDMIEVVAELRRRGVKVQLSIIGDGPDREEFLRRVADRSLSGVISVRPTMSHHDVLPEYARHDVFLLTSAYEGLPIALLEAMAQACVPVVSDIPSGIPQLIEHGLSGFRVPVGGIAAFASAIEAVAECDPLRQMISEAAREVVVREYTTAHMTSAYVQLFRRVVACSADGAFIRPKATWTERATVHMRAGYHTVRRLGRLAVSRTTETP